MYDQSAGSVRDALLVGWIYRHGIPRVLLTDQGRNVDGREIRELCAEYEISKGRSSTYHPAEDGEEERAIQNSKQSLRCQLAEQRSEKTDWTSVLLRAAFAHNTLQNSSTKFTPSELMYRTKIHGFMEVAAGSEASRDTKKGSARANYQAPSRHTRS